MVKELERANIPVAHICTITNVALEVGSNRVIPSASVLYPTGNPKLSLEEELRFRKEIVIQALKSIQAEIGAATIFEYA